MSEKIIEIDLNKLGRAIEVGPRPPRYAGESTVKGKKKVWVTNPHGADFMAYRYVGSTKTSTMSSLVKHLGDARLELELAAEIAKNLGQDDIAATLNENVKKLNSKVDELKKKVKKD